MPRIETNKQEVFSSNEMPLSKITSLAVYLRDLLCYHSTGSFLLLPQRSSIMYAFYTIFEIYSEVLFQHALL